MLCCSCVEWESPTASAQLGGIYELCCNLFAESPDLRCFPSPSLPCTVTYGEDSIGESQLSLALKIIEFPAIDVPWDLHVGLLVGLGGWDTRDPAQMSLRHFTTSNSLLWSSVLVAICSQMFSANQHSLLWF